MVKWTAQLIAVQAARVRFPHRQKKKLQYLDRHMLVG